MALEANNISFRYSNKEDYILKDFSFSLQEGEIIGLVGPSGYGKSTLAKILAGYEPVQQGSYLVDGKPLPQKEFCPVQLLHQHPELAVNPRWKMEKILREAGDFGYQHRKELGIKEEWLSRWPSELSGGELQRFCIGRILQPQVKYLICDEITTMLDAISQAQIWKLICQQQQQQGFGMLVISHNIALAKQLCHDIIDIRSLNHMER